jgi:hypothetical protein
VHLSKSHWLKFKVGLGGGTNNYAEIIALKLTIVFVVDKGHKRFKYLGTLSW